MDGTDAVSVLYNAPCQQCYISRYPNNNILTSPQKHMLCVLISEVLLMITHKICSFYIPPHNSGWVLWYHVGCPCVVHLCVRPSVVSPSIRPYFHFWMIINLSKCQWIFTKLSVCNDIVEIWFRIVKGQISSISDRVICP